MKIVVLQYTFPVVTNCPGVYANVWCVWGGGEGDGNRKLQATVINY